MGCRMNGRDYVYFHKVAGLALRAPTFLQFKAVYSGVKQPKQEADHSLPPNGISGARGPFPHTPLPRVA